MEDGAAGVCGILHFTCALKNFKIWQMTRFKDFAKFLNALNEPRNFHEVRQFNSGKRLYAILFF